MIADQILRETYDINEIAKRIRDLDYRLIVSVDGSYSTADENLSAFFKEVEMDSGGPGGLWIRENNEVIDNVWYSGMKEAEKYIEDSRHDFCVRRALNDSGQYENTIIADNVQYHKVDNGVNVLVFDKKTETVADMFGIDADNGYAIVR